MTTFLNRLKKKERNEF